MAMASVMGLIKQNNLVHSGFHTTRPMQAGTLWKH